MKCLVIQCAALGYEIWEQHSNSPLWKELRTSQIETVFPAVTCTVQASFRTASLPADHGMISNGLFDRKLKKTLFWEQSSELYTGERIWNKFRRNGGTVGQICWQQSLGSDSDLILSPAPIHKHHGGMIQDFFSQPPQLYRDLCSDLAKKFNLHSYWGPFTSSKSTEWITDAAVELLKNGNAADLQLVYLPHLDYTLQKFGPDSPKTAAAFSTLEQNLEKLAKSAKNAGYEIVIFGDYAIEEAKEVVYPNRILLEAGLFSTRNINGMLYPDLYTSKAFTMVDHQVGHVYISDKQNTEKAADIFRKVKGIRSVHTASDQSYIDTPNSGEIILEAEPGSWFAYQWWENSQQQPDYATHVDIHNKPGFDPCELFFSLWPPMSISTDTSKVKGTHGLTDKPVMLASTIKMENVTSIVELAERIQYHL
jgi:predicted AlkP superfamily pyrophosphatase or phosphodiesterase